MANLSRAKSYLLLRALMPLIAAGLSWRVLTRQGGIETYLALAPLWFAVLYLTLYWVDQVCWVFDERGLRSRLRGTVVGWDEITEVETNGSFLRIFTPARRVHLELMQFRDRSAVAEWFDTRLDARAIPVRVL